MEGQTEQPRAAKRLSRMDALVERCAVQGNAFISNASNVGQEYDDAAKKAGISLADHRTQRKNSPTQAGARDEPAGSTTPHPQLQTPFMGVRDHRATTTKLLYGEKAVGAASNQ